MGLLNGLPRQVGYGTTGFVSVVSSPFDVHIGELEFMLSAGPNDPLVRRGADYRTQQVNFSAEPGETALGFWWQREQSTWHNGAGNPTFDGPGSGESSIAVARYADSYGIDVWTSDQFSLLHDAPRISAGTSIVGPVIGVAPSDPTNGIQYLYWADGNALKQWDVQSGIIFTVTGSWTDVLSIASDGVNLYFTDGTAVYAFKATGLETLYSTGFDATANRYLLRWVKQRLMFAEDEAIFELDSNASLAPLPTPLFTHPSSYWTWSDASEGPGAIYASGYAGTTSTVFKFMLDSDGVLPTLTAGIAACELPDGEKALCLKTYIGLFIGIGTSKGIRVCSFSDTDIVLSPLTTDEVGPVRSITGWDRFLYGACDDAGEGQAGLIRVDLSSEIVAGEYAWARDIRANSDGTGDTHAGITGTCTGVVMYVDATNGETPIMAVQANGIYGQHYSRLTQYGLLTSGKMLFGMTDPKHFLRLAVAGTGTGVVSIATGVDSSTASLTQSSLDFSQLNAVDLLTNLEGGTLTIGITLNRNADDVTAGPTVTSYSAKALPAQSREEQWVLPLRCFDRTEMGNGETDYGIARDKLANLRELVRTQQPVLLQTFFGDPDRDWTSTLVHVEDFEYRQIQGEPTAAWGGIINVSCRTIGG